ncbi:LPS assembly lipoprotein LptE [Rhodoferax sp. GW822-FHT02A01]|uniref:LPS-assembly lipoprotein LptE n=1 Tax=Rhodoferax sp. GW822-FHT02A01 TaxID=3141537 RepID=UPI00315CB317
MNILRRSVLALVAVAAIAGCGFKLRTSQALPFRTIAVTPENASGVAGDIARYLGDSWRPVAPKAGGEVPEVILDILQEVREKVVVGVNASGQVREYELRLTVRFRLRSSKGDDVIAPSVIEQHRSISFNESAVLAKETEEALLYRDMQSDVVQQLMRRLAAVKPAGPE